MTRAEYYRDYRARKKADGAAVPRGKNNVSKFSRAHFIAWDGEGINTGNWTDEHTEEHAFIMFASSDGDYVQTSRNETRLSTRLCFDTLLSCASRNPQAIHVVYGGSYDCNQILRDIPMYKAKEIAKVKSCFWEGYYIEFIPRKSLYIRRGDEHVTLWDVIGFFQSSFVNAIEQWLGNDYAELPAIKAGKNLRGGFVQADLPYLREYNDAENRALVKLMTLFQQAVASLGLSLARWDGAGAVAAAIMRKHDYKKELRTATDPEPPDVEMAARHAYFGGRFELGQFGTHNAKGYGYDICSAYPTSFLHLPSLRSGRWRKISRPRLADIPKFALVHIRWDLPEIRFGPFPYRNIYGLVSFPTSGENWVWACEVLAAADYFGSALPGIELVEAYVFVEQQLTQPFVWVQQYYDERQRIINGESSLPFGCQMVIKLGLNSLYGKTAQNLGYEKESRRIPPYHSLLYAGFITAQTRAKLWTAAMQKPESIIMLATDGILTTEQLDLPITKTKELGAWEYTEYDYILAIQSGVYVTRKGDKWSFRKRGIETVDNVRGFVDAIRAHWGRRKRTYAKFPMRQTRLIGIRSAVIGKDFWARWGNWYHQPHDLTVEPGPSTKRIRDNRSPNGYPAKGLVWTLPTPNIWFDEDIFSIPYERPWDRETWKWDDPESLEETIDANEFFG